MLLLFLLIDLIELKKSCIILSICTRLKLLSLFALNINLTHFQGQTLKVFIFIYIAITSTPSAKNLGFVFDDILSSWGLGGTVVKPPAATAKGLRFESPIAQHVQRLISRAFTYGAVGSLVLRWSWTRQPGFISFRCLWIQLCNKPWAKVMCVQSAVANQAIHPFGICKLVTAMISPG